ncbi:MOSC domain-containing protein [Dokdonella sp.]|uniref:MOSC domain-containing protein n=1 Tax=Dokdonella sp. TaxID=2291710 RepID=UPI0025C4DD65|nr:MOSC domain-containing protein [Dokdonella sp.]MBX3689450.1 MOSC domain-containing protein [Dokdonella sp.]
MIARVSALHVYPIKSCAPWTVDEAVVGPRGFDGDRRWMVVDAQGRFITARKQPRLVLIRAEAAGAGLRLQAPAMPSQRLHAAPDLPRISAQVWESTVQAQAGCPEADAWISRFLGQSARFVHMDAACVRSVSADYGDEGDEVSFADGFPLLLISQAALDGLNERLAMPVPMLRFRPSLVVAGTAPHAEDDWCRIRVGAIEFDVVKPCTRCVFTTVDLEHGTFDPAGEPLKTLMGYRRTPKGVRFGQNLIPRGRGVLRVGDAVEVLQ